MAQTTMRAAQYEKATQKVYVHDIPVPEPGEGEFQVRIAAASLCHSDLMDHQRPDKLKRPVTMGHEAVGFISKIHPSVENKGWKVGDKIGCFYMIDCCFNCEGCDINGSFCVKPRNGAGKIQGLQADGFFAEYALIDWRNALRLPESLPMERMSPLFCAGITAFHSVDKCELEPGQFLAVVGCGGLGQLAIRYAKAMKLKVVALDIDDRMLERAKQCGADALFNVKSNFRKDLRKLTGSRGCHAAAVFSDSLAAYQTAQNAVKFNGVLMFVGLPQKPVPLPSTAVSFNVFRVKGASIGNVAEAQKAVDFTAKHGIIPDVSFRSLDDMPQMVDDMKNGRVEKRMVVSFMNSQSKL